tara:strand:+ start:7863 stop:8579 length:717 start_codon:yes stop_codon:yes gene_type:complete
MAGDWIKMRVNLTSDPSVIGVASILDLSEYEVVGLLHSLWSWADQHTDDGSARGVNSSWVDRYLGVKGFAEAMSKHGWLYFDDDGIHFPNFERHNGSPAKKRAQGAARQKRHRQKAQVSKPTNVPSKVRTLVEVTKKEFPHLLEDPVRKEALALWVKHRQGLPASGYSEVGARTFLKKVEGMPVDRFKAAVENSVANNYQGLFEPNGGKNAGKRKSAQESSESRGDYPEVGGDGPEIA